MKLPTGAAAAQARIQKMLCHVDDVARSLAVIVDDPTGCLPEVRAALEAVRADPMNGSRWGSLGALTHRARTLSGRINDGDVSFTAWDRVHQDQKDGEYQQLKYAKLEACGAPICDEHGPMKAIAGPDQWECVTGPNCQSGYLWIDGTHMGRAPHAQ